MGWWGCIPQQVFCKYNKKPKTNDVIAKCNVHDYIDNEGEDLGEKYLGKAIHIHPKPNSASEIMSKALYEKYKKSTKENDVNLIGAAASLSGLWKWFLIIYCEKKDHLKNET